MCAKNQHSAKLPRSIDRSSVLASAHLDPTVVDSAGDAKVLSDHVLSHVCTLVLQLVRQLSSDERHPADKFLGFISGNSGPAVGTRHILLSALSSLRSPSALALEWHSFFERALCGRLDISLLDPLAEQVIGRSIHGSVCARHIGDGFSLSSAD